MAKPMNIRHLPQAYQTQVQSALASLGVKIPPRQKKDPNAMNDLERKYGDLLELRKRAGEIEEYRFQPVNLRLADCTFYMPDFLVITKQEIQVHETKGFWTDDARVKIKVAAAQFWFFCFMAIRYVKKQWVYEEF